jgi:pimeloyl-ACP methyl ester carboxylesterase
MSQRKLEALLINPEYTRKRFDLSDGRRLSYSECGNLSIGLPVLFQFGLMASSLAVMMFHEESIKLGLRIIAVDYPGIGESSSVLGRTLDEWAIDMEEFCEKMLQYNKISLLAHSMGAPHALALLRSKPMSQRIRSVTLVSPWLPFKNSQPWFLNVARQLPIVFQDSLIPSFATTMTTSSLSMAGTVAMCSKSTKMFVVQEVTGYGKFQGQAGNKQMVRLALETIEIDPLSSHITVFIFHGKKDNLVQEGACLQLIKAWTDNSPKFTSLERADHNTILANGNLHTILATLVEPR